MDANKMLEREELLNRAEQANSTAQGTRVRIHRSEGERRRRPRLSDSEKRTVDQMMVFEIYSPSHPDVLSGKRAPDDMLVTMLKEEIARVGISRRDLYSYIGNEPGCLFENENQAYNLEYGLRQRSTISLECAKRWLTVLGRELVIEFRPLPAE